MAHVHTEPLFNEDRNHLLQLLQLDGIDSDATIEAVGLAIRDVSMRFYDILGGSLVDTIRNYPYSADPTAGENERIRMRAAVAEEKWVRAELLRKLPILFVANRGTALDRWNEEELTRDGMASEAEISRLDSDALEIVDILLGDTDGEVSAEAIGPDTTPVYRPGGTIANYSAGVVGG